VSDPTPLNCNEFVELVTAFLDGALDPATEASVVDHLASCDGCTQYLEQISQTIRSLGDLPPDDRSGELRASLLSAFRDQRR
jgi:anti-sigma factor RsiW